MYTVRITTEDGQTHTFRNFSTAAAAAQHVLKFSADVEFEGRTYSAPIDSVIITKG